jgi:hypothetical protein
MDPAVFSLIGVGLGATLSTGGSVFNDRLRSNREANAKGVADAKALRLAVRLVLEELAESGSLIEGAAKSRQYWPAPRKLPTATWDEYKTEIASAIEAPLDWRIITAAYDSVNSLNWTVEHRRRNPPTGGLFWVESEDETREKWRSIRLAIAILEQTIAVQGPASRVLREREDAEREFWPFGDGDDFDVESAEMAEREAWQEEQRRLAEG